MPRPPDLDRVVRYRTDGTAVTASEHVLDRIRLGADFDDATAGADITRQTLWNWRRAGGNARARSAQGHDLDDKEQRYAQFLDALERAEAETELSRLAVVTRAGEGGMVLTKKRVKAERQIVNGQPVMVVVEETTITETIPPQWTAAAWFLERRFPEKYRRRIEVDQADHGQSAEERARDLADSLRAYMQGVADAEEAKVSSNGNGRRRRNGSE
jgi:hypothetical protein